ncbi:MAG: hypothetical protein ACOC6N_03095 [archaeon]
MSSSRMAKLIELIEVLDENGGCMSSGDLYSYFAGKYGVEHRTYLNYLKTQKKAGKIT